MRYIAPHHLSDSAEINQIFYRAVEEARQVTNVSHMIHKSVVQFNSSLMDNRKIYVIQEDRDVTLLEMEEGQDKGYLLKLRLIA